jgi:hypothetical protein
MIKDIKHLRKRIHEVDMLIMLIHDTLATGDESDAVLDLLQSDVSILLELVTRMHYELNS